MSASSHHPSVSNTTQLAVSADGALLAAVGDAGVVSVWEVATRSLLARQPNHPDVYRLAFAPGPVPRLASTSWDGILMWDARTDETVGYPLEEPAHGMSFSGDGRLLAGGLPEGPVHLVEPATGRPVRELLGHTDPVYGVAFLPGDRRLVTAALDGDLRLWDAYDGSVLRVTREARSVYWLDVSPTGNHLVCVTEDTARVTDVDAGTLLREHPLPGGSRATFSADGELLVLAGTAVTVWGVWYGRAHGELPDLSDAVLAVAAIPGTTLIATGHATDDIVRLWDLTTMTPAGRLTPAPPTAN
jgi:WD40 repeat protein